MSNSFIENPIQTEPETEARQTRRFEDLSLSEVLEYFIARPRQTWNALRQTLGSLPEDRVSLPAPVQSPDSPAEGLFASGFRKAAEVIRQPMDWRKLAVPVLTLLIVLLAVSGSILINSETARYTDDYTLGGLLLLGSGVTLAALARIAVPAPRLPPLRKAADKAPHFYNLEDFLAVYGLRVALLGVAVVLSLGACFFNVNNAFTPAGLLAWGLSILAWVGVLSRQDVNLRLWVQRGLRTLVAALRRPVTLRWSWSAALLIVILLVGAWFRFNNLSAYPPDMTSDHVEKALDAYKVLNGSRPVFFPNNGGREVFQMYFLAFLHNLTGAPIGFDLLKLGSGLEGMLMIVLAWWMGRAVFGEEDRSLGNLVGLIMAAMVATSYWHTMLSRLGLRIVLTTLAMTVIFVFLARALRRNRRGDYLIAGLALGTGMYLYQAMRMAPLVVIVGVILALLFRARSWQVLRQYLFNTAALVIVSLAVFAPLGVYMIQYPGSFWERTGGRFFGEDVVPVLDADGRPVTGPDGKVLVRHATPDDRWQALQKNITVFVDNFRRSVLMFNARGDNAWITGEPGGSPAFDAITGAFFVLGLGVVAVRMFQRRDPVDWLLPLGITIMVLPSALSIAFVIEVPSASRASGALPMAYLIAALGMAVVVRLLARHFAGRRARYAIYSAAALALALGGLANAHTYFEVAMPRYRHSTFPYRQAGDLLRGFIASTGAPGNAFMIAWDYWWDHRAVGIESGDPAWDNGVLRDNVIERIVARMAVSTGTRYELRPDRQLLFFYYPDDEETAEALQRAFPGGSSIRIGAFTEQRDFYIYVAPPVGCEWVMETLNFVPDACAPEALMELRPGG